MGQESFKIESKIVSSRKLNGSLDNSKTLEKSETIPEEQEKSDEKPSTNEIDEVKLLAISAEEKKKKVQGMKDEDPMLTQFKSAEVRVSI